MIFLVCVVFVFVRVLYLVRCPPIDISILVSCFVLLHNLPGRRVSFGAHRLDFNNERI